MTLPDWLSDEGVRCFRVPEHVGKLRIMGGSRYWLQKRIVDEALITRWVRIGGDSSIHQETEAPYKEGLNRLEDRSSGILYLVAEEVECSQCIDVPPWKPGDKHHFCMECENERTLTQHRLIREDAEELEVGGYDGKPNIDYWLSVASMESADRPHLLLLHPTGQRHEVKR